MTKMSFADEVLYLIKETPGITAADLVEFFPDKTAANISALLSNIYSQGNLVREKLPHPSKAFKYTYQEGAKPQPLLSRVRENKGKTPTPAGLEARLEAALETIAELEALKADAQKRYPDLAVPLVTIRAREIVAKRLAANGDKSGSEAVLKGHRDDTVLIQSTIDALEYAA